MFMLHSRDMASKAYFVLPDCLNSNKRSFHNLTMHSPSPSRMASSRSQDNNPIPRHFYKHAHTAPSAIELRQYGQLLKLASCEPHTAYSSLLPVAESSICTVRWKDSIVTFISQRVEASQTSRRAPNITFDPGKKIVHHQLCTGNNLTIGPLALTHSECNAECIKRVYSHFLFSGSQKKRKACTLPTTASTA